MKQLKGGSGFFHQYSNTRKKVGMIVVLASSRSTCADGKWRALRCQAGARHPSPSVEQVRVAKREETQRMEMLLLGHARAEEARDGYARAGELAGGIY